MKKIEKISLLGDNENGPHKALEKRINSIKSYHENFQSMIAALMCADVFLSSSMQVNVPIKGKLTNLKTYMEEGHHGMDYDKTVTFVRSQAENQFPYLTNNGIVKLFSYLEETIRSLIISIFKVSGNIEKIPTFEKVKLNIHEYLKYEPTEFYEFLYSKYQEQIFNEKERDKENSYVGYGIDRFERQLKPLGLSGKVDDEHRENIYQLIQLRHCIVHRDSIVDSKLIEKCPKLNFQVGDEVTISLEKFSEFHSALQYYLLELIRRLKNHIKEIEE